MWRDMERQCAALGLPLQRPDPFPQASVLAARISILVAHEPVGPAFCRCIFSAEFGEGRNISNPQVLGTLLEDVGLPTNLLVHAGAEETKQALRTQGQTAVGMGLFGAPSFVVDEQLFWGDDRLEQALNWATNQTNSF